MFPSRNTPKATYNKVVFGFKDMQILSLLGDMALDACLEAEIPGSNSVKKCNKSSRIVYAQRFSRNIC